MIALIASMKNWNGKRDQVRNAVSSKSASCDEERKRARERMAETVRCLSEEMSVVSGHGVYK